MTLKILIAHNYYQQAGGEDNVVAAEKSLLEAHDHHVNLWSVDNKDLAAGLLGKVRAALSASYSMESLEITKQLLRDFQPDVVHVHNFFPQISPSIFDACLEANVPVVQTLHNYRLICPGAFLMRDGHICEQCIKGSPYQAALYGCYRGSKAGSLVVAHMVARHRQADTWRNKVTRFIALTDFAKSKFVEAGFPADKISVKPNFVAQSAPAQAFSNAPRSSFALFVGRLSAEKGIDVLSQAWRALSAFGELKAAGDGPLAPSLADQPGIELLGRQSAEQIKSLMAEARFLVLPSVWYEGFPMVLVEAFACGLPVLASRLGSMCDIVDEGVTGLFFRPGDSADLIEKARWLFEHPEECERMSRNAREKYLSSYTAVINYRQLLGIYEDARKG